MTNYVLNSITSKMSPTRGGGGGGGGGGGSLYFKLEGHPPKTCYDFRKCMGLTSNILDQKSRYRSRREGVVLVRIKYLCY